MLCKKDPKVWPLALNFMCPQPILLREKKNSCVSFIITPTLLVGLAKSITVLVVIQHCSQALQAHRQFNHIYKCLHQIYMGHVKICGSSTHYALQIFFKGYSLYKEHATSSNGNIFRVTGPLCREFTGHRWIPLTDASDAELWCFLWSVPEQAVGQTLETPVIWYHCTHYDVTVMEMATCSTGWLECL